MGAMQCVVVCVSSCKNKIILKNTLIIFFYLFLIFKFNKAKKGIDNDLKQNNEASLQQRHSVVS